ncbi:Crp/Fnr family transcriptional regulator [Paraburkholderia phymatum]|uniref:Crp/Fnr family transcriptional regulator n=1 Tax=Paraburkholderia phymatum TaxID=148447 RepID=A0ACC6UBW2_9BURK
MSDNDRPKPKNRVSIDILRRQRLLSSLDENALRAIAAHVRTRQFKRRDMVIHRGEPGFALMFLFSGRLQQISLNEDGREIGLGFIEPGDYFGLTSIIDGHPQTNSVVAISDALVGYLDREHAERFLLRSVEVTYLLLCQLCESIRQGFDDRSRLGVTSSRARIYAVLSSMTTVSHDGMVTIERPPSQRAIAITANVSRETVSRAINVLIENRIIRKDRGRYLVLDEQTLHRAALGEVAFGEARSEESR